MKKSDWLRTCNVVSALHRFALFLRFRSINNRCSRTSLTSKTCLCASWSNCDRKIEYVLFFIIAEQIGRWKIQISQKIISMQKSTNNEILWKIGANNCFFKVSSFTSFSGGNHSWRFTAGWKFFEKWQKWKNKNEIFEMTERVNVRLSISNHIDFSSRKIHLTEKSCSKFKTQNF